MTRRLNTPSVGLGLLAPAIMICKIGATHWLRRLPAGSVVVEPELWFAVQAMSRPRCESEQSFWLRFSEPLKVAGFCLFPLSCRGVAETSPGSERLSLYCPRQCRP